MDSTDQRNHAPFVVTDIPDFKPPLTLLLVNSVVLGIVLVLSALLIGFLVSRRNMQPLKKKSPQLIILSVIGNMAFCLFLLILETSYQSCLQDPLSPTCNSVGFSKFNCFMGFILLTVCEPISILPYIFRSIRLYVIFKAQDFYFKNKRKPIAWFKWIKERRLINLCLIWAAALTFITLALYVVYIFDKQVFLYAPSYTVWACYKDSILSPVNSGIVSDVSLHTNISITFLIIMHFCESCLFIICLYKLRNIKDDFNIKKELTLVFIVWFTTSFLTIGLFIHFHDSNQWDWIALVMIFRNITVALITTVPPIYQTYVGNSYILLPPNQESIESLDMVLHIPIASEYFYEYLDNKSFGTEGPILFSLYADLRYYDKACSEDADDLTKYQKAQEIIKDYLTPEGQFHVQIDREVLRAIESKFKNLKLNLNEYLFIELYAFVLDKLREHFENFKRSNAFIELEDEISRQEKLYEVLVDASIIAN